ncbi:MAG: hypothetical protein IJG82_03940 [Atopobiaceae bacterium]|nr:hypothetical protein [Atopobiaceae bacterium]
MSFEEFCEIRATNDCYDYEALVEAIERGLPQEDILLRAYDRERLAGGDLFQDVCEAAGITWNQDFTRPVRGTNPSVSYDVAEALRRLRLEGTTVRIGAFRHLFSTWHPDPPGMTPFTPDAARAFSERYIDGYQRLSERHFDGKPLFSSDYNHPKWVPNEDRIASYRRWFLRAHKLLSLPGRFARKIRKADKRG